MEETVTLHSGWFALRTCLSLVKLCVVRDPLVAPPPKLRMSLTLLLVTAWPNLSRLAVCLHGKWVDTSKTNCCPYSTCMKTRLCVLTLLSHGDNNYHCTIKAQKAHLPKPIPINLWKPSQLLKRDYKNMWDTLPLSVNEWPCPCENHLFTVLLCRVFLWVMQPRRSRGTLPRPSMLLPSAAMLLLLSTMYSWYSLRSSLWLPILE